MYLHLLAFHNLLRWVVLIGLLIALIRGYQGWLGNKAFTRLDNRIRVFSAILIHVQLIVGLILYAISPLIRQFFRFFGEPEFQSYMRFFGMDHATGMLIGITLITIGSAKAKRKSSDREKFKALALWYTAGIVVILGTIPWPFMPHARPLFRPFM